jgi:hypothetical protein
MSANLQKLKSGAIDAGKYAGYFTLGLIALPFYASYWAIVKLHDTGKELLAAMQNGIATLKKNMGESWDILISSMKKSYSDEIGKMQPAVAGAAPTPNIVIGNTYMYKGREVEAVAPGADGSTKVKPVGKNTTYAVKSSDLTEKTNDSYSYIITNFKNFNY